MCSFPCGVTDDQRITYLPKEPKLSGVEATDREVGGPMLNVTGLNRFYYLRDFTDMRCKYSRVLSIIREQLHREPDDGDEGVEMAATYHSIISTVKMQGRSAWEYLDMFFTKSLIKRIESNLFDFLSVKTLSKSLIKRTESSLFEFLSVKTLSKILNGCRDFFSKRPDRIFVPMSAEPNLFDLCRVQPKIMK